MANLNLALIESKSLRDDKLNEVSNEKALESLNKAKALIMAFWKGENIATTAQIAEFYEVSEDIARKTVSRHRDEFESDGLKVLRGKALNEVRDIMSLSPNSPNETIWNPRCALRLGMLLRDSEIAKLVRTVILDSLEVIPAQSGRIRELELELELTKAKTHYMDRRDAIRLIHGAEVLALLDGRPDIVIEKVEKVTETIICKNGRNVSFEGRSTAELGKELGFKSGKELERWLGKNGHSHLVCQGLRVNQASYIPTENLKEVKQLFSKARNRQLLIGE